MKTRKLGKSEIEVSSIGLGCMGLSEFYGHRTPEKEAINTLHSALDLGINFFDTSDYYGDGHNEILLGQAIQAHGNRDQWKVATKCGIVRNGAPNTGNLDGNPAYIRSSCEASLSRLQLEYIDLYYLHRVDPNTPIEETVGELSKLVEEGKVREIGLSEVSVNALKKAHTTHPIAAVQTEYSPWSREPESGLLQVCKENNICFVPYSPLGRGYLVGGIKKSEELVETDWRRNNPRFQPDAMSANQKLAEKMHEIAQKNDCTASQLSLAWMIHRDQAIVPIPGSTKITHIRENIIADNIELDSQTINEINTFFAENKAIGTRYPEATLKTIEGNQ